MKNKVMRWCINWWADSKKPKWLAAAICADPELRAHEAELVSLAKRLRGSASTWADAAADATSVADRATVEAPVSDESDLPGVSPVVYGPAKWETIVHRGWSRWGLVSLTTGLVLIFLMRLNVTPSSIENPRPLPMANAQGVNAEINALVSVCHDLTRRGEVVVGEMPNRFGRRSIAQPDGTAIIAIAKRPIETASRAYGKALAFMELNMREQLVASSLGWKQMRGLDRKD